MTARWTVTAWLAAILGWTGSAAAQGGGVSIAVDQFGVGSVYRPGEMVGIRVALTSDLDEPTSCWVQWEMPNAEGDIAELGRSISIGPGIPTTLWLYAPLPPNVSASSIWRVRVFEEKDGRRTRELGSTRIGPAGIQIELADGLIGIVGSTDLNLSEYGVPGVVWQRLHPPGAHEATRTVAGIAPVDLPDRWWGLKPFEAIAWSNAQPQNLRDDPAEALRDWIRRGGHLIISLPQAGNPWGLGTLGQTYLDDLLPGRAPRVDEGVLLGDLMHVLSKSDIPERDIDMSIRVFKEIGGDYDVLDNHYEPLIALADGRVVVIQRTYGFGRITISGIELSGQLRGMRLPQADVFWNRILGRRADTPGANELAAMTSREPPLLRRGAPNALTIGDGRLVEQQLDKRRNAEVGLLLALVLFAAYLLIAGPGGFFALKQRGLVRHSWLAFAGTAAVFTAIAWGGARLLRPHGTELRHVTFLDHVARPPDDPRLGEPQLQRATMFGILYVPSYGTAEIAIASDADRRDLLQAWTAPEKIPEKFPNVSNYRIDLGRAPADYRIPVRATATQLSANWLGALDPEWGGMIRVDPGDPVRVGRDAGGNLRVMGTLVNDLPGSLTDVTLTWVTHVRGPRLRYAMNNELELEFTEAPRALDGRPMLNLGFTGRLSAWDRGTKLPLVREVSTEPSWQLGASLYKQYVKNEEPERWMGNQPTGRLDLRSIRAYMEMLGFYHQLTPPKYHRLDRNKDPETVVFTRKLGRELDLSAWYSRPCLIVTGFLANSPTPVPFTVDGEKPPKNTGLTMVRWIYPLPLDEAEVVPEISE